MEDLQDTFIVHTIEEIQVSREDRRREPVKPVTCHRETDRRPSKRSLIQMFCDINKYKPLFTDVKTQNATSWDSYSFLLSHCTDGCVCVSRVRD